MFDSSVRPRTGAMPGATLHVAGTGAEPSASYLCLLTVYSTRNVAITAPLKSSIQTLTSDPDGGLQCAIKYAPFSAKDSDGHVRHCPTTAEDRQEGFVCGVVLADASTLGGVSASQADFTPAPR